MEWNVEGSNQNVNTSLSSTQQTQISDNEKYETQQIAEFQRALKCQQQGKQ